jgi:uncharacterized membrane protein
VGRFAIVGGESAFRYDVASNTIQNLGTTFTWRVSEARAASADGTVVAGNLSDLVGGYGTAFRWTAATGMQMLGSPFQGSTANAVSRDGTKIIGTMTVSSGNDAYVWTELSGYQSLPSLGAGGSVARGMNFDGSIIVGGSGGVPALWRNGVAQGLSSPAGFSASGLAVDAAGSVVVGTMTGSGTQRGYVWTPTAGPQHFEDFLQGHGIMFPMGWRSETITAVSDDGLTFSGTAFNVNPFRRQGFVVTIPAPAPLLLGIAGALIAPRNRRR